MKTIKSPVKVFYVGDKSGKDSRRNGVLTIATEVIDQGENVKIAFAYCSTKDMFSRKIGRSIAYGRLNTEGKYHVAPFTGHSADDAVYVFNLRERVAPLSVIPRIWKKRSLANIAQGGLTFLNES